MALHLSTSTQAWSQQLCFRKSCHRAICPHLSHSANDRCLLEPNRGGQISPPLAARSLRVYRLP